MALNTHRLGPSFPSSSSSFLTSAYTQINHLHLQAGLPLLCLSHVFCLLKFLLTSLTLYERFSLFMCLSPFISLHFHCWVSVSNFHLFTLSLFFLLLFIFPSLYPRRPSRWLVFVSLSLVAAAGSGLNNEITFSVGREAARSSTLNIITRHSSHKYTCESAHNPQ